VNARCTIPESKIRGNERQLTAINPRGQSVFAPDNNHAILARLIEILAPGNGDLVAFLECYFDESGSHAGSPVLCVAGYVFEQEHCKALDLGWKQVLDRYHLPFFHMTSCAHKNWPFDHLSRDDCIDAQKAMIGLINEHALFGVAMAINERDYVAMFGEDSPGGSPYSFCCWQILAGIRAWIDRTNFQGEIAYFFESGHDSEGEADALMKRIFKDRGLSNGYRYAAHAFVDKQKVRPVQTADILAWHWATQMKRWLGNDHSMRADCRALMSKPRHELFIGNRKTLGGVIAYHRMIQGLPVINGISGRFGHRWFWSSFDGQDRVVI
jgi:Protein of unknown function (DUF3800)